MSNVNLVTNDETGATEVVAACDNAGHGGSRPEADERQEVLTQFGPAMVNLCHDCVRRLAGVTAEPAAESERDPDLPDED